MNFEGRRRFRLIRTLMLIVALVALFLGPLVLLNCQRELERLRAEQVIQRALYEAEAAIAAKLDASVAIRKRQGAPGIDAEEARSNA